MVEYVGGAYAGFQRQPGKITVQGVLEDAVYAVTQEPLRVDGSGRTDAGAHATHQVVAFTTGSALSIDVLQRAINAHLPYDVAVTALREADAGFNPRRDAHSRVYRYLIWNRPVRSPFMTDRAMHVKTPLDVGQMNAALNHLVGRHDLSAFVPVQTSGSRVRTIFDARCWRQGHLVTIQLEATGFMRQMVRAIAGTLVRVGGGALTPQDFARVLAGRRREMAGDSAPAHGLYLIDVKYSAADGDDDAERCSVPWLVDLAPDVNEETA